MTFENDIVTVYEEEDEDTLVEDLSDWTRHCFSGTHASVRFTRETFVQPVPKRVLTWAMSKWAKHIVTFNEEEDEDTLVEE